MRSDVILFLVTFGINFDLLLCCNLHCNDTVLLKLFGINSLRKINAFSTQLFVFNKYAFTHMHGHAFYNRNYMHDFGGYEVGETV